MPPLLGDPALPNPPDDATRQRLGGVLRGVLLALAAVLVALAAWPWWGSVGLGWVAVALGGCGLLMLASLGWMVDRLQRHSDAAMAFNAVISARAVAEHAMYRDVLDAMHAGVVLYGPDDRILLCNRDFRELYGPMAERLVRGAHFETLLREALSLGLIPEAGTDHETWLKARIGNRREPHASALRQLRDGRWRRIAEQRLPDGKLLAFSIDVTELVARERELAVARDAERRAALRLEDAVNGLPDGFVLFDASDRLVMCNHRYRQLFGLSAAQLVPGARFEDIVRHGLAQGQYPEASADPDAWLAALLQNRRFDKLEFLRELPGDQWVRVRQCRSRDGGLIGVFTEVTAQIQREKALEAARADAHRAQTLLRASIDALPAGVEVYDEDDKLILFNAELSAMYPHLAPVLRLGPSFEALARESLRLGIVPEALGREEAWLAERLAKRAAQSEPLLRQLANGRWIRIYETRSSSGAVVAVRLDVTDLIGQQQALVAAQQQAEQARLLLEDAIEGLADGFAYFDADDRLVLCNQRYCEIYQDSAAAMVTGTRFEAILRYGLARGQYPEAAGQETTWLEERMHRHLHPGPALMQELPGRRWFRIEERRTRNGGIVGVRTDVTELVQRGQELGQLNLKLAESRAQLQAIISTAMSVILTVDDLGQILFANRALSTRLGWSTDEVIGRPVEFLLGQALPDTGCDVQARHQAGHSLAMQLEVSDFQVGHARYRVCLLTDVSEREATEQALRQANVELEALSETDALTGLANRRCLDRRLREEWDRAARHKLPLAMMMIDVDHFKRFNDLHGHQAGDDCLRRIALTLRACASRSSDVVARYGGEEFVLLLPHSGPDEARRVADNCLIAMDQLAFPHGDSPVAAHVTLTIGLAMARTDLGDDPLSLLQDADAALYQAKVAGRHRTGFSGLTTW